MTPEEFRNKVIETIEKAGTDTEASHIYTDNLMESLLIELGFGDGVAIIKDSERWYT